MSKNYLIIPKWHINIGMYFVDNIICVKYVIDFFTSIRHPIDNKEKRKGMVYDWFVNITLFSFCIVDTKFYKVRNDMIISAIAFYIIYIIMSYGTTNLIIMEIVRALSIFIISQVVLSILSMVLTVSYGDIKLIGVILSILGLNDGLYTVFLGSCFSLFLIYRKTVEKLPMGYVFYIGYLIHFFIKGVLL